MPCIVVMLEHKLLIEGKLKSQSLLIKQVLIYRRTAMQLKKFTPIIE